MIKKDTIAAIATAAGEGAIAVIRFSGEKSIEIVDKIFRGQVKLSLQAGFTVHYGHIVDDETIVDEVLISIFKNPHSYTGENSVEISCHGSVYIQQKILETAVKYGARQATAGEFTMRAFLNGKLDLSQAEAVADLIASKSKLAHRVALNQLKGDFSDELQKLRSELVNFVSLIELELDFSEEDVEFAGRDELKKLITKIKNRINILVSSFSYGNAIKNGIPVAIVGSTNVGKSTLLNALLKTDKAIVSDIAGTTRDTIEDLISINGISFRFIDTAGLRNTKDIIENLGIERSIEQVKKSEIILFLVDATQDFRPEFFNKIKKYTSDKKLIIIFNKIDVVDAKNENFEFFKNYKTLNISAKERTNITELEKVLVEMSNVDVFSENDIIISNIRHYEALKNSFDASERVISAINNGVSSDLLTSDIREMLYHLGQITGEVTNTEILNNIFKNFCIGK